MLSHFQWKPLNLNLLKLSWEFSFYYQASYYQGVYYNTGTIEWFPNEPEEATRKILEAKVHELMLYHVYEEH